MTASSQPPVP